jgi:hypothetical protein
MTFETEKTVTVRISDPSCGICEACDSKVAMRTVEEAARLASISPGRVVQLIESGCVHFRTGPSGILLICLDSLLKVREGEAAAGE